MTKHTNIYLDSASRRQRGSLSTRTLSGQAATKIGLAVDQKGWPTLWRSKGYLVGNGVRMHIRMHIRIPRWLVISAPAEAGLPLGVFILPPTSSFPP